MTAIWLSAWLLAADPAPPPRADWVLTGGLVVDGTGQPAQRADVALRGERIVAVGSFPAPEGAQRIDCTGLIIAPGFIDLHTHSDDPLLLGPTRANLSYLAQGVTTVVTGNCGAGPEDVGGFFKKLEKNGVGANVIHLVPHNAVRSRVLGNVNRAPTEAELTRMKELVAQGLRDGAWGLSTGLIYNPGTYSRTEELIALARVAGQQGGIYASHIRDEGSGLLDALQEAIRIGREARLPVHVSHIKVSGRKNWGKSADAIALIERARREGLVVTADQYPYTASSTSLRALVVPAKYREGSSQDFQARLADPDQGPKIRAAIEQHLEGRQGGQSLRVAYCRARPTYNGKDLAALADQEKRSVLDVVLDIERLGGAQMVAFGMSEEDVRLYMRQPWVATASDGSSKIPDASVPHPRSYGTFARKIGLYALRDQVVSLEHAIRSASGLPAEILRLPDRGVIKAGAFADLVVFDPKTYRDTATYDKPHQFAPGVRHVWINGQAAWREGRATPTLAGRVLRHAAPAP